MSDLEKAKAAIDIEIDSNLIKVRQYENSKQYQGAADLVMENRAYRKAWILLDQIENSTLQPRDKVMSRFT